MRGLPFLFRQCYEIALKFHLVFGIFFHDD